MSTESTPITAYVIGGVAWLSRDDAFRAKAQAHPDVWIWTYRDPGLMLAFYRKAFAITAAGGTVRLSWAGRDLDAAGWRKNFRDALDRRINLKMGPPPPWRKLDGLYQTNMERDARAIHAYRQQRVRFYHIATPELRKRFGHLMARHDD